MLDGDGGEGAPQLLGVREGRELDLATARQQVKGLPLNRWIS